MTIDKSEIDLQNLLGILAKNPKNKEIVIQLFDIYKFLLSEISEREMNIIELSINYTDLRAGTMRITEANSKLTKLLKSVCLS